MIKKNEDSLTINKSFLVLLALLLFYSNYKLVIFSPSIILAVWTVIYFSPWLLKQKSIIFLILMFLLTVILRPEQGILEFGKFIFMIGSFLLIKYFNKPTRFPQLAIASVFLLELFLRIYSADSFSSMYSIKSSGGMMQDSNFTGLFLAIILSSMIWRQRPKFNWTINLFELLSFIFFALLLLLTFSRTALLFLFFLILSRYSPKTGFIALLFLAFIIIFNFLQPNTLSDIDGSLESKRMIFLGFLSLVNQGIEPILFGVGRDGAFDITSNATNTMFAGHTIFGQIVEFGLVINTIYYLTASIMIVKLYGKNLLFILIPIFAIGLSSLSPLSYLGILCFLYAFSERCINHIPRNFKAYKKAGIS